MGVMHPASDDSAGTIKSENLNESENDSKGKFLFSFNMLFAPQTPLLPLPKK